MIYTFTILPLPVNDYLFTGDRWVSIVIPRLLLIFSKKFMERLIASYHLIWFTPITHTNSVILVIFSKSKPKLYRIKKKKRKQRDKPKHRMPFIRTQKASPKKKPKLPVLLEELRVLFWVKSYGVFIAILRDLKAPSFSSPTISDHLELLFSHSGGVSRNPNLGLYPEFRPWPPWRRRVRRRHRQWLGRQGGIRSSLPLRPRSRRKPPALTPFPVRAWEMWTIYRQRRQCLCRRRFRCHRGSSTSRQRRRVARDPPSGSSGTRSPRFKMVNFRRSGIHCLWIFWWLSSSVIFFSAFELGWVFGGLVWSEPI